jgi:vitamin B12/bleomycin/antimicrobial peptide transport system ATP-binding/permease protein
MEPKGNLATYHNVWRLIRGYFQSEHRLYAYFSFSFIIFMTVAIVGVDVAITYWFNYFYDALQAYDKSGVVRLLGVFCVLATIYILLAVYRFYVSQMFGLRWRQWLTAQFIARWLSNRNYYYLETFDQQHTDNPDQRIQDDVGALISYSIDLATGLVSSVTSLFGFVYVLWQLSGTFHIHLGSWGVLYVPGYLVWVSVLYSVIGTYFTFKIGKPLVSLNFEQQRREATFRFAAIDLRTHAENVALYRGEDHQKNILQRLFASVIQNWYFIIIRQRLLLWFTAGYNQISVLLPLLVALPNYFEKVFRLGGLMQSMRAFSSIQDATSFFVNSYTTIALWRAVAQRLTTFVDHMDEIQHKITKESKLVYREHPQDSITTQQVSICLPDGGPLLKNINEEMIHGSHYLIKGDSGVGKSTFVRALAEIWPFGEGQITYPEQKKIMYLPQRPYMPIGTLTEAIQFPDKHVPGTEKQLEKILRDVRLEHLIPRLQETASWSEQFSPGEQQRIAFARVLLQKPDWVFLDESTSMLDLANEEHLYRLLHTQLPNCSIVSVGHRPSLDVFHDHVINMAKYSDQKPALA